MQLPRQRTSCRVCPLKDRRRVWAETPDGKPVFAIFGEAPGRDEDREGLPFIGGAGSVLNWALKANGINRGSLFLGNILSCRPPENDIRSFEASEALTCCRGGFLDDLNYLADHHVRTIMALGDTAMRKFGIEGNITKNRGSVYQYQHVQVGRPTWTFIVIPSFHPAFIMRQHWKRDGGGTGDNAAAWLADFAKAMSISQEGWEAPKEDFELAPTPEVVEQFVDRALKEDIQIAVDTETTSLSREHARVVVIGLADSASHGICVPLLVKWDQPFYSEAAWARVRTALDRLFRNGRLLLQNSFYDIPILINHGFVFNFDNIEDTLMLHHTLSPESEHNLGFIVSVYGKTPYWKEDFLGRKGSIFDMDTTAMRTYNLRDCVVLKQVYDAMITDLKELDLWNFYQDEVKPLLAPVMEMTLEGVGLDLPKMNSFRRRTEHRVEVLRAKVLELGRLPPTFSLDSGDDLRWFLYGEEPGKFRLLADFEKSNARFQEYLNRAQSFDTEREQLESCPPNSLEQQKEIHRYLQKVEKLQDKAAKARAQSKRILDSKNYQKLSAVQDLRDLVKPLYDLSKTSLTIARTETEKASVDDEAMLSIRSALLTRLEEVKQFTRTDGSKEAEAIQRLLTWIEAFTHYKTAEKIITSFTKYSPDSDGRIRPNWKTYGTSTGRLSCSGPNLMQLPKRTDDEDNPANEVREFFRARPGWKFISCDYVNLEVYILAFETLDPDLLAVTEQGLNIHDLNTRSLFGIDESHPHWKTYRKAAKVFQFGRLQYGGGDRGVYQKVLIQAPEAELSFRQFAAASAKWMQEHPRYVEWYQQLETEVRANRSTRTGFGRQRIFLGHDSGLVREALSTKIQSAGASLMNRAMRRIYEERNKLGLRARFVLQVHDQLVMEAPDAEVEIVQALMVAEMERPFVFQGFERWIAVDATVGETLGAL